MIVALIRPATDTATTAPWTLRDTAVVVIVFGVLTILCMAGKYL